MFFKGEVPFLRLLIPLIAGIALGINWPVETVIPTIWLIPTVITLFVILMGSYRHLLYRSNWLLGIVVQVVVLLSGCILTLTATDKYKPNHFAKFPGKALIITVITEPQISGEMLRFDAQVNQSIIPNKATAVSGKLRVFVRIMPGSANEIRYGSTLIIRSTYQAVDPPFNPGEFNLKRYLEGKQIYHQAFSDIHNVEILSQDNANQLVSVALRLRQWLVKKIYRHLDSDAAALASTLILGYRSALSEDIVRAYSKTGTLHILSVSGMHVALVFIILTFILKPFYSFSKLRLTGASLIIAAIWCYSLVTGFSPSVCRAAAMMTFIVTGKTLNRSINNYNLLAVSAFLLLIYNPYYLVDVGFQLSYLAVFGLIFLQPKIFRLITTPNKWLNHVWNYSALSIAAQLATFPVSMYYFHQFPVYFLLSNLIVVLPVALIMYLGIFFLFIPWHPLLHLIGAVLNVLIEFTNKVLFYIEALPLSSIGGIWLESYQYILIYLIISGVIWAFLTRQKSAFYSVVLCSLLFASSIAVDRIKNSRQGEVIFYSLRQRSAVAYIFRRNAYLITNLADSDLAYTYSIKPALDSRGVRKVIFIKSDRSLADQKMRISPNYFQFESYKILRWDSQMNYLSVRNSLIFRDRLKTDAILISGNPSITIGELTSAVNSSVLIVDGSNSNYRIKKWQAEAKALNVAITILKRSPAYIVRI